MHIIVEQWILVVDHQCVFLIQSQVNGHVGLDSSGQVPFLVRVYLYAQFLGGVLKGLFVRWLCKHHVVRTACKKGYYQEC